MTEPGRKEYILSGLTARTVLEWNDLSNMSLAPEELVKTRAQATLASLSSKFYDVMESRAPYSLTSRLSRAFNVIGDRALVSIEEKLAVAKMLPHSSESALDVRSLAFREFLIAGPLALDEFNLFAVLRRQIIDFFVERLCSWEFGDGDTPLFQDVPDLKHASPCFENLVSCPAAAASMANRCFFAALVDLCLIWCLDTLTLRFEKYGDSVQLYTISRETECLDLPVTPNSSKPLHATCIHVDDDVLNRVFEWLEQKESIEREVLDLLKESEWCLRNERQISYMWSEWFNISGGRNGDALRVTFSDALREIHLKVEQVLSPEIEKDMAILVQSIEHRSCDGVINLYSSSFRSFLLNGPLRDLPYELFGPLIIPILKCFIAYMKKSWKGLDRISPYAPEDIPFAFDSDMFKPLLIKITKKPGKTPPKMPTNVLMTLRFLIFALAELCLLWCLRFLHLKCDGETMQLVSPVWSRQPGDVNEVVDDETTVPFVDHYLDETEAEVEERIRNKKSKKNKKPREKGKKTTPVCPAPVFTAEDLEKERQQKIPELKKALASSPKDESFVSGMSLRTALGWQELETSERCWGKQSGLMLKGLYDCEKVPPKNECIPAFQCSESKQLGTTLMHALRGIRYKISSVNENKSLMSDSYGLVYDKSGALKPSSLRKFLLVGPLFSLPKHLFALRHYVTEVFYKQLISWKVEDMEAPFYIDIPDLSARYLVDFFPEVSAENVSTVSMVARHVVAALVDLCLYWCLEMFQLEIGSRGARFVRRLSTEDSPSQAQYAENSGDSKNTVPIQIVDHSQIEIDTKEGESVKKSEEKQEKKKDMMNVNPVKPPRSQFRPRKEPNSNVEMPSDCSSWRKGCEVKTGKNYIFTPSTTISTNQDMPNVVPKKVLTTVEKSLQENVPKIGRRGGAKRARNKLPEAGNVIGNTAELVLSREEKELARQAKKLEKQAIKRENRAIKLAVEKEEMEKSIQKMKDIDRALASSPKGESVSGIPLKTALGWQKLKTSQRYWGKEPGILLKRLYLLESLPLLDDYCPAFNCPEGQELRNKLHGLVRSVRYVMDEVHDVNKTHVWFSRRLLYDESDALKMDSLRSWLIWEPLSKLAKQMLTVRPLVATFFIECLKSWNVHDMEAPFYSDCPYISSSLLVQMFPEVSTENASIVRMVFRHLFAALFDLCLYWCLEIFDLKIVSGGARFVRRCSPKVVPIAVQLDKLSLVDVSDEELS